MMLRRLLCLGAVAFANGGRAAAQEATCSAEWREVRAKMEAAELSEDFIQSFKHSYDAFVSGDSGTIPESAIDPVGDEFIPTLEAVRSAPGFEPDASLLDELVILKLNGGLGTSMGLERAKSLLHVQHVGLPGAQSRQSRGVATHSVATRDSRCVREVCTCQESVRCASISCAMRLWRSRRRCCRRTRR